MRRRGEPGLVSKTCGVASHLRRLQCLAGRKIVHHVTYLGWQVEEVESFVRSNNLG